MGSVFRFTSHVPTISLLGSWLRSGCFCTTPPPQPPNLTHCFRPPCQIIGWTKLILIGLFEIRQRGSKMRLSLFILLVLYMVAASAGNKKIPKVFQPPAEKCVCRDRSCVDTSCEILNCLCVVVCIVFDGGIVKLYGNLENCLEFIEEN